MNERAWGEQTMGRSEEGVSKKEEKGEGSVGSEGIIFSHSLAVFKFVPFACVWK